jgi:rhodanese-related sulfurtransferase
MKTKLFQMVSLLVLGIVAVSASAESPMNIYEGVLIEKEQKTQNISTEELRKILADKSPMVFDVRPYQEYVIDHIPGAINVAAKPGVTRDEYISDIAEIGRIVKGNKAAPIVLYCSGPFCGKSERVAKELVAAGYTNVRRYQLGIPVWRALGGVTEIELEGVKYVVGKDQTAVLMDVRDPDAFKAGTLAGARNIPQSRVEPGKGGKEVKKAKKDGRLPMEDHNTRIIVFGRNGTQAKLVAEALAKNAFHNVSYYPGTFETLQAALK